MHDKLFEVALGITQPWFVAAVRFDEASKVLTVGIDYTAGSRFAVEAVRVLDLSIMIAGPYCARYLADLGAEVIKVEPPEGDYIRTREPLRGGRSAYFAKLNCGERSIRLDLKDPAAIEIAKALAAKSDVVVENCRPGVMKRLGIGYDVLSQGNSGLVYCAVSGFGQDGPGADRLACAQVVQASSGYDLAFVQCERHFRIPSSCTAAASFARLTRAAISGCRTCRSSCRMPGSRQVGAYPMPARIPRRCWWTCSAWRPSRRERSQPAGGRSRVRKSFHEGRPGVPRLRHVESNGPPALRAQARRDQAASDRFLLQSSRYFA